MKALLYWSFKPRMAAKRCHSTPTSLSRLDTSFGTWDCAEAGSLCPQYQVLWPLPGSSCHETPPSHQKRMHPIDLGLSTSRHKVPCWAHAFPSENLRHLASASAVKYSLNGNPSEPGFQSLTSKHAEGIGRNTIFGLRDSLRLSGGLCT